MGLEHAIGGGDEKGTEEDKDHKVKCPSCREVGEKTGHYYFRCTSSPEECEVLSFIPSNYESDR